MSSCVSPLEQAIERNRTSHQVQRKANNIDEPEALLNLRAELAGFRGQLDAAQTYLMGDGVKSPSKVDLMGEFGL